MEGTKKKIPAILLACLMAAALALVMNVLDTQPAYASNFSSDAKLYIDGQDVNPNESASSEKDGWTYSNGTLTLYSANISHIRPDVAAPVHVEGMDLTIFINTHSYIDGASVSADFSADYGIYMAGGTLTIDGADKLIVGGNSAGIALDGGELVITGNADIVASSTEGAGIFMYREVGEGTGNFTIEENCIVEAVGVNDAGIYMDTGGLIVNGGKKLKATALGELDFEEPDFSIFSRGDIKMQNTRVDAPQGVFSGGNVTVEGSKLITGSKQSVIALITGYQEVDEPILDEGGIEPAYGKGGDITIKNSQVTSEGYSGMRASGSIKIEDTKGTTVVKASAIKQVTPVLDEDDGEPVETNLVPAFTAVKDMTIGDNLKIVEPEGGILGRYQMIDSWTTFATVLESNGKEVAMDVLIKATSKPQPKPTPKPDNKTSNVMVTKMTAVGSNSLKFTWTKMKNVDGYDIFFANCSMKSNHVCKPKLVKTIKGNKKNFWIKTNLKKKTAYKAYIKAWVMKDGKKQYVKKSPSAHAYTGGTKKVTNVKSVKVKKRNVILTPGKTFKIKAKLKKVKKGKKLITSKHAKKLRYISSDTKIATVSKGGRIKAKAKGTCKIFVIAINGATKVVNVTVR